MNSNNLLIREFYRKWKDDWEIQSILWEDNKVLEDKQDLNDIIEQNRYSILEKIQLNLPEANKWLSRNLRVFIKDYLNWLSLQEDWTIYTKLNYYLEIYELFSVKNHKKLDEEIVIDRNNFSKAEILFELLYNNTLLPKYENKKQFTEEMLKFLPRVEKSIEKFLLSRSPVIIHNIDAQKILTYMKDMQSYHVLWSEVIKWWLIKQIWFNFYLWQNKEINEDNDYYYSFMINDKELLTREEFIYFLTWELKAKNIWDQKEFFLSWDNFFNYSVYVWEEMYENYSQTFEDFQKKWLDEDWFLYNWFEVRVYAQSKRNFDRVEDFSNMCNSLPWVTEKLIKEIYYKYWLQSWEKVWFPEKAFIFRVDNNLNVRYDWDNWEYTEAWESILKSVSSWETTEIPYDIIDLSKRERKELLLNKDLELFIKTIVEEINNPEKFLEAWLKTLDTWVIFYWPGWVWKSELCYEIAYRTIEKTDFSKLDLSVLFNKYLWESEKLVAKYFSELRLRYKTTKRKQISFIDEIDWLISNEQSEVLAWVRSKLLTELSDWDNEWLIFLWTTNFIEKLSWPISRRFSKKVWVELPDGETRRKLFEFFIKSYKKWYFDWIDTDLLVKKTNKKSHAFIDKLLRNTLMTIITLDKKIVTTDDILELFKMTDDEINKLEESNEMWFRIK